ncbi:MAG: DNA polymerase [Ruminococcus sp.]|nr:DNA polymerase [Ruminococcus sp.]
MKELTIDIETRSKIDLKKCGLYKYAESKDFDVLLVSYSIDGGKVCTCDVINGGKLPDEVLKALVDETVIKKAFNVNFERVCMSVYLRRKYPELINLEDKVGNYLSPVSWHCDMIHSRYLGMPSSLEDVGALLRLKDQKMEEGKDLIKAFCTAQVDKEGDFFYEKSDFPKEWKLFKKYNKRDVEVELAIQRYLSEIPVPDFIWNEFYIDQYINDRGILVDKEYVEKAVKLDNEEKQTLYDRLIDITSLDNPNSHAQMKDWLEDRGIETDSLDKESVQKLLDDVDEEKKEALLLYQQMSKASVKKYDTMLAAICDDNRARGMFSFYGANRTGRFAGRHIQLQNLPQNHLDNLAEIKALVKNGDFGTIRDKYDDVSDVLSQLIRTSFVPSEGKKYIVSDFSAIEARVVAWIADEHWRLEAFKNGEDIYCASASKMFGVPVEKNGINSHLRQKGKVAELACGYGGSIGAIKNMGGTELHLTDDELKALVNDWRKASPNIVKLWDDVQKAAEKAVLDKASVALGKLTFSYEKGILFIELPSKRRLAYIRPKVATNEFGKNIITYEGIDNNKKWAKLETYGAKLVENTTQGIARDLLMHSIATMKDMEIVGHVHDEIIVECDTDVTVDEVCGLMEKTPEWAEGLLLRAEGYECNFYMKQ